MDLQEYNYEIKYIPGKTNTPADTLSRPPEVDKGDQDNQEITLILPEQFTIATSKTDISKQKIMKHVKATAGLGSCSE
jgi:hypothetical protein